MWFNFAHLFSVSLLPLSTAWMAVSELAPQPVAFYAAVFFLVNLTYIFLIWELIDRTPVDDVSPRVRRIMRFRSIATLCLFGVAAVVALKYPLVGLGICCCCLIVYLKPDPPGAGLALEAGLDRTYVSQVERGKRNATVVVLARIAKALKATRDRLLVPHRKSKAWPTGKRSPPPEVQMT